MGTYIKRHLWCGAFKKERRAVGNFTRLLHSCSWSCSLPKVLLTKFCGGLFLSFGWHPTQICTVCIGLIKMVHHRTYVKWISYGYGCSYHDTYQTFTLYKFREIAAATHREALMVSTAILTSFQDVKKWLWTVLIAKICIRLKIRMRTSIFQNSNENIVRNLPWKFL